MERGLLERRIAVCDEFGPIHASAFARFELFAGRIEGRKLSPVKKDRSLRQAAVPPNPAADPRRIDFGHCVRHFWVAVDLLVFAIDDHGRVEAQDRAPRDAESVAGITLRASVQAE